MIYTKSAKAKQSPKKKKTNSKSKKDTMSSMPMDNKRSKSKDVSIKTAKNGFVVKSYDEN